jgi:hypothetical protein
MARRCSVGFQYGNANGGPAPLSVTLQRPERGMCAFYLAAGETVELRALGGIGSALMVA